jgi:hypothetical protein
MMMVHDVDSFDDDSMIDYSIDRFIHFFVHRKGHIILLHHQYPITFVVQPSLPCCTISCLKVFKATMCTAVFKETTRSPVRHVDPVVRALNTIMYGLVVHFGTMWAVGTDDSTEAESCSSNRKSWWATALLFHEYWVYLQHSNVLANPLCQRLDRQYGIALLRSNQHWAIAGTLSAYWCRETFSMFLCLPLLKSSYTQLLVLYSLVYHTVKSVGVRQDALRRYSPTFGIMRVVIDNFYHFSATEQVVSLVRIVLQGLDTLIHAIIISDLFASPLIGYGAAQMIHVLFAIWVAHAALNQYFTCSTATIMVQAWNFLTAKVKIPTPHLCVISDTESDDSNSGNGDDDAAEGFEVRRLLRPGRVPDDLKGKQGAASNGVDTAVRVETLIAIIAAVYIVGLGDAPLKILVLGSNSAPNIYDAGNLRITLPYAWLLWSILYAASVVLLPRSQGKTRKRNAGDFGRQRSILYTLDVAVMVVVVSVADAGSRVKVMALLLGFGITAKSFLKAEWRGPKIFWTIMTCAEIISKVALARWIVDGRQESVALVGAVVCVVWSCTMLTTGGSISDENIERPSSSFKVADIVFLGHPAELSDCWALWLLPYSLEERWKRPWWAVLLWPFHYLVGYYTCNWRQKLYGDGASFFNCDDVIYEGVRTQTWVAAHFGRHFVTSPRAVRRNIEAAARYADDTGVKVLCLGALNKAESINGGGVGVVQSLGPHRKVSVIHGNHLTAAAVVETTHQCFGDNAKVFLTGELIVSLHTCFFTYICLAFLTGFQLILI